MFIKKDAPDFILQEPDTENDQKVRYKIRRQRALKQKAFIFVSVCLFFGTHERLEKVFIFSGEQTVWFLQFTSCEWVKCAGLFALKLSFNKKGT